MKYRNANASRTKSKQPLELLFKSRRSQKFRNISRKPLGESLNKVVGVSSEQSCRPSGLWIVFSYEYCEILKATLKPFWKNKNNFEDHPAYDCFWLGIQTAFVFSFSKNVIYPNHTFLSLDFSLFSLRGLYEVLKRAFLNFLFTAMLY